MDPTETIRAASAAAVRTAAAAHAAAGTVRRATARRWAGESAPMCT